VRPCPICGRPATLEDRPFCSKRCAEIDLHRWLSGAYTIAGRAAGPQTDEAREDEDDGRPEE